MQTIELQNELIRRILEIENVDLLKKVKSYFNSIQKEKTYKLSETESLILNEREVQYKKNKVLISNEDVFKEIEAML
ncbi:MAG: hypothetical protein GXO49_08310 [Chlorobi bacterium]|nr:hypothetical protein [Chlorobiota bacterium]